MIARPPSRVLVTTADERSWPEDRPILFLGEWCRRPSRRLKWGDLDASVVPYHWDNREKYYRDYDYLDAIYERLLEQLSARLGALHRATDDVRFWRIIVGPWLRFFSDAVFDRLECVRAAVAAGGWDDTVVLRHRLPEWGASGFRSFFRQLTSDSWNHVLFAACVRALGCSSTESPVPVMPLDARFGQIKKIGVRALAAKAFDACGRYLPDALNGIVITGVNLPKRRLFRLQRALGQLPYVKTLDVPIPSRLGRMPRESLACIVEDSVFGRLLAELISEWMPRAYVEDFGLVRDSAVSSYPRQPRAIFTETSFQGEDGFNVWAAYQTQRGVPLVIGQHGGNMGIARINQSEQHQIRTADAFVSWGWSDRRDANVRPLPALKLAFESADPVSCEDGDVLILMASYPRYFYCHYSIPVAGQVLAYVKEQLELVELLDAQRETTTRVRMDADIFGWDTTQLFHERGFGHLLEPVSGTLLERLRSCRLAVSTYNATSLLETLALNFPSVIVLNGLYFETRPEAAPALARLRAVGILHDSPASAADHILAVADDVRGWWQRDDLQAARREFCHRYARRSADWLGTWKSFLATQALSTAPDNASAKLNP